MNHQIPATRALDLLDPVVLTFEIERALDDAKISAHATGKRAVVTANYGGVVTSIITVCLDGVWDIVSEVEWYGTTPNYGVQVHAIF